MSLFSSRFTVANGGISRGLPCGTGETRSAEGEFESIQSQFGGQTGQGFAEQKVRRKGRKNLGQGRSQFRQEAGRPQFNNKGE